MPLTVRCERDGCVFTVEPRQYLESRKTYFYTSKEHGDLVIDCPRCGRGYFIEDDGVYRADRRLTILKK